MAKVSPLQNNFSGGEWSPIAHGRVDAERYNTGLDTCENFIPLLQGPVTRRPGTYYVASVKTSSAKTRLYPFEFSVTQAYILEFGNQYIRFYRDNAQIDSGGSPYEIATPYVTADLFQLKFTQSADTLYITHPSYAPRKLTRTAHTAWTLTTITFVDGPYLNTNTTATTITPSGTTGAITLTASASLWVSTDVGRLVRIKHGATWGYATITGYTSATVVNATVTNAFGATTASTTWRLGVWSDTTGYPACTVFHEDRLFFAGVTNYPQRIDGSKSASYEDFSPSDTAGTIASDNAVSFSLVANDVNVIRWLATDEKGLLVGSIGGEWVLRPSSSGEAITPTNVSAKKSTSHGSANIEPIQVGKSTVYIQRSGRKFREELYFYEADGFRSPDMTQLGEHVTKTGITEIDYQKEPYSIIWGVRTDGVLISATYEREVDSFKVGWARHILGGVSDAAGNDAIVESVAVIPAPSADRDEVWLIVKRYINGATVRTVEYLTEFFNDVIEQRDAFNVDCGLTYDDPKTITGATAANPVVITSNAHGFSNGDIVYINDVEGMTELNEEDFTVANVTANTFELSGINGTAYTTYISGGEVRKYVSTISGLTHLQGQTVQVCADGATHPDRTVAAGAITLQQAATTVHVGLGYDAKLKLLRNEAGAQDGTSLGKTRRVNRFGIQMYRTLGLEIGFDFDNMDFINFRTTSDPLSRPVPLFTGIKSENVNGGYDFNNQFCIRVSQPLPAMILAVMPQLTTQDR